MTQQEMINAIIDAIQDDTKLIIFLRFLITSRLPVFLNMADDQTARLQVLCQALGIDPTIPPGP